MESAFRLFVNGLGGVFAGMAVLYLAMKVIALFAERYPQDSEKPAGKA